MFSCQDCTKSVSLDIKNKMKFIANCIYWSEHWIWIMMTKREILWHFDQIHQNIDRFIFHIHWWKSFNKYSFEQDALFQKNGKRLCLYGPIYLPLDDYPPYSDKNSTFLRKTLTNDPDVFIYIHIMMNIIYWLLWCQ